MSSSRRTLQVQVDATGATMAQAAYARQVRAGNRHRVTKSSAERAPLRGSGPIPVDHRSLRHLWDPATRSAPAGG